MNETLGIGTAFVLGMLHALEPGHGKAFIASYMVGEKLKLKNLFSMVGSMLVSHFLLLTILTLVVQLLFQNVDNAVVLEGMNWVAPVVVTGFGVYLFFRYRSKGNEADCACGHDHGHDHSHSSNKKGQNPALVGAITGLLPCPTVLAPVMLSATAAFDSALMILFTYVLGMILVMGALVLALYMARQTFSKQVESFGKRVNLHVLSAVLIICVGVVYFSLHVLEHSEHSHGLIH